MAKAKLEFNLPEEETEFILANKGSNYFSCLVKLDQECREHLKYGYDKKEFKTPDDVFQWVRDFITENVNLEEIE